jgi:hypothetical protein
MTSLKDRAAGTAKEIAGEVLGDGRLAEDGKRQKQHGPPVSDEAAAEPANPLAPLRHLT